MDNRLHRLGDDDDAGRFSLVLWGHVKVQKRIEHLCHDNNAGVGLFYGNLKQVWIQRVSVIGPAIYSVAATLAGHWHHTCFDERP